MPSSTSLTRLYTDLADWHERQRQMPMRDRFLVLAADTALSLGDDQEAERLRQQLLQKNPHHMQRPFSTFAEALRSPDVQRYLHDLRRTYPPEAAQTLFESLGQHNTPPAGRSALKLPPTKLVIDLNDTPDAAPSAEEPLKVYRLQEENGPAATNRPIPPPTAAGTNRPPVPRSDPLPPYAVEQDHLFGRPGSAGLPESAADKEPPGEGEQSRTGKGVCLVLFVLVLTVSLAVAAHALLRPLLLH